MDQIMNFERKTEDDLYVVLGCCETSSMEQILAEYKAKALELHPDKNINDESCNLKFQRLLKAKEILCDPEKRRCYDKWRKSGIAMTFEQFSNLGKAAHTSMHWANKKQKEPMLRGDISQSETACPSKCQSPASSASSDIKWKRENPNSASLLNKFRNYEI